jgi:hypothetical protein
MSLHCARGPAPFRPAAQRGAASFAEGWHVISPRGNRTPAKADVAMYGLHQLNSRHNRHRYNPHTGCRHMVRIYPRKNRADARTLWGKTGAPRKRLVWGKTGALRSKSPVWVKSDAPRSKSAEIGSPARPSHPNLAQQRSMVSRLTARPSLREVRCAST